MFNPIKSHSKQKGFTLVELLVSVGLFSVVLTVTLGSILTIADSNKKARSLMSVMNNLNFAVDSITRSFKSGRIEAGTNPITASGKCLTTNEIDYAAGTGFTPREVRYCFVEDAITLKGQITKQILSDAGSVPVPLTSPDVDVDYMNFAVRQYNSGQQPAAEISIEGTVKVSEKISSKFLIQTTVSQRQLNI